MSILTLPTEIIIKIFEYLDDCDKIEMFNTSAYFKQYSIHIMLLNTYSLKTAYKHKDAYRYVSIIIPSDKYQKYQRINDIPSADCLTVEKYYELCNTSSIKTLKISRNFNKYLKFNDGLTEIEMGESFDQPFIFPDSLRVLTLTNNISYAFNIPNSVIEVCIQQKFNQDIILPLNLQILKISRKFNHPIILPHTVKYAWLGGRFNQFTDIPTGMLKLYLGNSFNLDIVLPYGIKSVTLGEKFNYYSIKCHLFVILSNV